MIGGTLPTPPSVCDFRLSLGRCLYLAYRMAGKDEKTLKAYEKAHDWRELFTLAKNLNLPGSTTLEMVSRVTGMFLMSHWRASVC